MAEQSQILKRVGVIGGGQLAMMMADAAKSLGISIALQTPHNTDPAVTLAQQTVLAEIEDAQATAELGNYCDVITFENEFVDLESLFPLSQKGVCFRPGLEALSVLLDKYDQLCFVKNLGLPTPEFRALTKGEEDSVLPSIKKDWGFPIVLKTRRHGYDGQGTFICENEESLRWIWGKMGYPPLLVQEFVTFERELAVMAARSVTGEIVVYPAVETYQSDQVCHWVIAPALLTPSLTEQIQAIAYTLLEGLQTVGIFGIELFLTASGEIFLNEIAPRTHNSGHFTLDACQTSQFEQHLRAVSGLALSSPQMHCQGAVMVNLLGYELTQTQTNTLQTLYTQKQQQLTEIPNAFVHWYGKAESRPGRKLGHVTILLNTQSPEQRQSEAIAIARKVESIWYTDC
ncbi:MAG: 5-(carboxyamino)imidazole ribonucleotide synthase [Cyanobacteria bacterium J06592_8]